jgi:PAS domain S-box-containing protein
MKHFDVKLRLGATFCLLTGVLFFVGWQGVYRLRQLNREMQGVIYDRFSEGQKSREAFQLSDLNSRILLSTFLIVDQNEIARLLAQRAANSERISGLFRDIESHLKTEEEKQRLATVEAARKTYVKSYQQALAMLLDEHQREEAQKTMMENVLPAIVVYHAAWDDFTQYEVARIEQVFKQSKADFARAQLRVEFLILLASVFTVVTAVYITVRVTREVSGRERAEKSLRELCDQLEQRVRERTIKLARTNQELQTEVVEHTRTEKELRWKTAFLEAQVNSSIDGILVVDQHRKTTLQNQRFVDLFKIPPPLGDAGSDEDRLRWVSDRIKNSGPFFEKVLYLYAHPNEISHDEIELNDGTILDRHTFPAIGKDGTYYGRIWTFRDITERKQAESLVRQSEERYRSLFDNARDAIFTIAADGRFTSLNSAVEPMAGILCADWIGKPFGPMVHPGDLPLATKMFHCVLNGGQPSIHELRGNPSLSRPALMEMTLAPQKDENGKIIGVLGIGRDITERKKAEGEMENIHKQLIESSRLAGMAEIATNVLHNVGNVLNSVNISTGLIVESVKNSKVSALARVVILLQQHEHDLADFISNDPRGKHLSAHLDQLSKYLIANQETLIGEAESLRRNVEHIKEIVAMQQGYAKVGGLKEMINVVDLVQDSLRMNEGSMSRHQVEIIREFENVPAMSVQKHKILQILVNLMGNAKHACEESGRAHKRLTVRVANGDGSVKISVIDNGIGIPPENLARIFNYGFTTKKGGHGFGLHNSALAACEMGGSLSVCSDGFGRGAAFTLKLPCPAREISHE